MPVTDSRDPILVPPVGSGSRVIVRKILPGVAMRAVVLADRSPGALAQVRTPALPVCPLLARLFQSELFVCHWLFSPACQQRPRPPRIIPNDHEESSEQPGAARSHR